MLIIRIVPYFPMQKFLKMLPKTSSVVISSPVISAKQRNASRMSCDTNSPESPEFSALSARFIASKA